MKKLYAFFEGQPKFRLLQAKKSLFKDLIEDWDGASVFSKDLRLVLKKSFRIAYPYESLDSKDKNSTKALICFDDAKVETVLMRHDDGRNTVCVSSQAGCPMNCAFCATGQGGFNRNLSSFEMIYQVLFFERLLAKENQRVSNVVFMGMGEPLLNLEEVFEAIVVLNDPECLGIGARKISVSTCGIPTGIERLSEFPLQINLAISLHASTNEKRNQIMPVNKNYPLEILFDTIEDYFEKTNRKVMFEYLMLKDFNDLPEDAENLSELLIRLPRNLFVVNLILYNLTDVDFKPSSRFSTERFKRILEKNGISVIQRFKFGEDIKAACGQLAGKQKSVKSE